MSGKGGPASLSAIAGTDHCRMFLAQGLHGARNISSTPTTAAAEGMMMPVIKRFTTILALALIALAAFALVTTYRASALNSAPEAESDPLAASLVERLHSEDPASRVAAAQALSGSHDPDAIAALIANLADNDPQAGYATAMALSTSGGPEVVAALIARLESENVQVRQRAALALAEMDVPDSAVPALSAAMEEAHTAQPAALALARMESTEAHGALLTALADKDLTTRRHAAMAALERAAPAVAEIVLSRALTSDDPVLVRNAAELRAFLQ